MPLGNNSVMVRREAFPNILCCYMQIYCIPLVLPLTLPLYHPLSIPYKPLLCLASKRTLSQQSSLWNSKWALHPFFCITHTARAEITKVRAQTCLYPQGVFIKTLLGKVMALWSSNRVPILTQFLSETPGPSLRQQQWGSRLSCRGRNEGEQWSGHWRNYLDSTKVKQWGCLSCRSGFQLTKTE